MEDQTLDTLLNLSRTLLEISLENLEMARELNRKSRIDIKPIHIEPPEIDERIYLIEFDKMINDNKSITRLQADD